MCRTNIKLLDPHICKFKSNMDCLMLQNISVPMCNCNEYSANVWVPLELQTEKQENWHSTLQGSHTWLFKNCIHAIWEEGSDKLIDSFMFLLSQTILLLKISLHCETVHISIVVTGHNHSIKHTRVLFRGCTVSGEAFSWMKSSFWGQCSVLSVTSFQGRGTHVFFPFLVMA